MKHASRTVWQPKPANQIPKWFRPPPPRLSQSQIVDLGVVHHQNLELIAKGQANEQVLWDWVGSILAWSRVAQLTGNGVPEMNGQLELADAVIERFKRTRRVGFDGAQLQQARDGAGYMDQLAEITPAAAAEQAVEWAEQRLQQLADATRQQLEGV